MKGDHLWFQIIYCHGESGCIRSYSTFQGELEIKYLLQGGMSGKESVLAMPSKAFKYLINMDISVLNLSDHRSFLVPFLIDLV